MTLVATPAGRFRQVSLATIQLPIATRDARKITSVMAQGTLSPRKNEMSLPPLIWSAVIL